VDFTREPIIETVITPKEGCKLVVRSSKSTGQEEYFVDAVEVVSFGHSFFFRSLERPKMFFVPATDYEILEVRETRMVLKNVGVDRAIKIAGGREPKPQQHQREQAQDRAEAPALAAENSSSDRGNPSEQAADKGTDEKIDKKRDRRRHSRRRRGRDDEEEGSEVKGDQPEGSKNGDGTGNAPVAPPPMTALLPPPPTLISETIARYKDNALFKNAFYSKEEQKAEIEADVALEVPPLSIQLEQPQYGSFEVSEAEEEQIYLQRKQQKTFEEASPSTSPQGDEDLAKPFEETPLEP